MNADRTHTWLEQNVHVVGHVGALKKELDAEESACEAFGYLRGIKDRSNTVEFRFKNGNTMWFPYSWLGPCQFDPSQGLLLKFSGDMIYLVLIRGSNLDQPINDSSMTLTSGLQRHRITWVREMREQELKMIGDGSVTIDGVDIEAFATPAEASQWIKSQTHR
ncbi:MAG TPA: hypothetical protein VFE62_10140 [Gemmataceae bacterium]|nr:hypothetical protein [Gemmataceae bacterium]